MSRCLSALAGTVCYVMSQVAVAQTDEFVPLALAERESVSGKALMIAAYAVIFGLITLYTLSLFKRQRAVEQAASELKTQLEKARTSEGE